MSSSTSSTACSVRPLFGGGLSTVLPSQIIDASELRQVPDTQEVFLFHDSDVSVIFEILEIVNEGGAGTDLREAIKFHFNSLAHDNSAFESSVDEISTPLPLPSSSSSTARTQNRTDDPRVDQTHLYCTLQGTQTVSKFNLPQAEADLVKIFLCLVRVDLSASSTPVTATEQRTSDNEGRRRGADITLTVNVPLGRAATIAEKGDVDDSVRALEVQAKQWFDRAVESFRVVDYGLFA